MKNGSMILILLVAAVWIFPVFLSGQQNTCITAECHQKFKKMKVVHEPVNEDCTNCHEAVKNEKHKFKFANKENLCTECHSEKKEGKVIHEAISSGECADCHDPHGGANKALLKTKRIDTLCYECHEKEPMNKKYIHGPNISGNCALCHESHTSNHKALLLDTPKKVCTRCHTDQAFSEKNKSIHTPMKKDCSGCHNPHSSDHRMQLINDPEKICNDCHKKITDKLDKIKFKHPVVHEKEKCYNCHNPHGSPYENNLKISPLKLCLDCHNKPIIGTDGKDYNVYKIVTDNPFKHGPVKDGNCSGCHDPHGSDFYMLLKKKYPKKFYIPYQEGIYDSCFDCHEKHLARDEHTTTLTNFRDGNWNLHFVHINRKKGRTCRACHEIHAGTQPKHVRVDTPFGNWSLPIGFELKKDGGYCAPGCHKPFSYDRNKLAGKKK